MKSKYKNLQLDIDYWIHYMKYLGLRLTKPPQLCSLVRKRQYIWGRLGGNDYLKHYFRGGYVMCLDSEMPASRFIVAAAGQIYALSVLYTLMDLEVGLELSAPYLLRWLIVRSHNLLNVFK